MTYEWCYIVITDNTAAWYEFRELREIFLIKYSFENLSLISLAVPKNEESVFRLSSPHLDHISNIDNN